MAVHREETTAVQTQLSTVQAQIEHLGEERAAHVQALREQIAAADTRHAGQMEEAEKQVSELKQQLQAVSQSASDAKSDAAASADKLAAAQQASQESADKAASLQAELESQQKAAEHVRDEHAADIKQFRGRVADLKLQLDAVEQEQQQLAASKDAEAAKVAQQAEKDQQEARARLQGTE